jgi:beta-glucanase (GH16 family)
MIVCGTVTTYGVTNLVWSDEFNGSSSNVDLTKWSFDLGNSSSIAGSGWGNQEKETYTSRTNNAFVANGLLHIIVLNDQGGGAPYSSVRLQTLGKFSATYGRVEIRAKLPANGSYWWPALWMLAANYSNGSDGINNTWPRCGEIDIMESKGSTPGKVQGTLHKDSSSSPGVDQASGGSTNFPASDGTTNFHTYVVSWSSNSISFAVDNNAPYKTITSWSSSTGPFPAPFNKPFYIIMNLAVGGTFFSNPGPSVATINAASTFPAEMDIDYVRVYQDLPSPPGVLSISPTIGCADGGTSITISGTNFLNGATVSIGGVAASGVVFVNSNTLTAVTPANSAGAMNVAVSNPDTSMGTLTNGFTYSSAPTFAGLGGVTPAIEGATLTWSASSGVPPFSYDVWEGTQSFGENYLFTTGSLSAFVPLYPGSNSPITYFFVVQAVDGCGITDGNLNELTVQPLLDPSKSQVGDGIPNGWKQQYGFNSFDPTVAAADPDGDGLWNLQEYLLGTDPRDKNSPFHVTGISQRGNDLLIAWADAAGRTNLVEAAFDIAGVYSNISGSIIVPGSGVGATNYLDTGAATNSLYRFYRVRVVP